MPHPSHSGHVDPRGLRRYARLLTGDRDSAHDTLADALIKAHLRWNRIEKMDHRTAYVRAMVTNGYLSEKRRWTSRFVRTTLTGGLPETAVPSAGRVVDDRDQLDQLLRSLPGQQRAAIVLRFYLDAPDAEIAAELNCSPAAIRTYVSRGLATLRIRESSSVGSPDEERPHKPSNALRTSLIGDSE